MTALNGYIQGLGSSRTVRKTGTTVKLNVYDNIDRVIVFNEAGETSQSGTPTPDNPVDIVGIGTRQLDGTYSVSIDYDDDNGRTGTITASGLAYPLYEGDVLDFVNGKVIRANGYIDLGTLTWVSENSIVTGLARAHVTGIKWQSIIFCEYFIYSSVTSYSRVNNGEIALTNSESTPILRIRWEAWGSYSDAQIKTALDGVIAVHKLATPVDEYITLTGDISDIGTAVVEADGTLTVKYDKVEMAVRKYSNPPDWSKIDYSDTPTEIISAFDYAREIQKTWTSSSPNFNGDKKLFYFPDIDISGKNRGLNGFFQNSNLMHVEPLTIGEATPTGVVNCQGMFQNTWVEDVTMTAKTNTQKYNFNDCFSGCRNLKKVTLNMKADTLTGMFYDCRNLKTVLGIDTSEVTNFANMFENCINLEIMPPIDTSSATSMYRMFRACEKLQTMEIATYNYSHVTNFEQMFWQCTALKNLPWINFMSATNLTNMFQATGTNLTEQSRDNLLRSLTSAIAYTGTKTLQALGFSNSMYSAASWQALPHYSDFTTAGWTIGYS